MSQESQKLAVESQAVDVVPVKSQLESVGPVVDVDPEFPRLVGQGGDVMTAARRTDRTTTGLHQIAGHSTPSARGEAKQHQHQPTETPEDMSVVCGDGKEVYAHQSILTAWS